MVNISSCHNCGKCCKTRSVLITFRDLREIREFYPHISLLEKIVLFEPHTIPLKLKYFTEDYPLIHLIENGSHIQGYLGLKSCSINLDELLCPFYDSTQLKCSIHAHKPLICRIFPFLTDDNLNIILEPDRCPYKWVLSDQELVQMRDLIKKACHAHEEFIQEVKEWNESYQEKTLDDFVAFILREG